MLVEAESHEGFVNVMGYSLYFRTFGKGAKGTVLCLHGGPGATHDYMLPLADLVRSGYRVFFYDQLGCGRSEMPKNKALFVMERYVEELEGIRRAMALGKVHVVGSSCGGQLAIAYALKYQKNLKTMTTIGGLANVPFVAAEMARMKSALPPDVVATLYKYEELGAYDDPNYIKAADVFYRQHVCRLKEWPEEVTYSLEHMSKPVYNTMNGPNEFTIIGNIRYWDVTARLGSIKVPTLVTCGKYDEVSPREAKSIHRGIRGSKLVVFQKSSHMPFWEERAKFMGVLGRFLDGSA